MLNLIDMGHSGLELRGTAADSAAPPSPARRGMRRAPSASPAVTEDGRLRVSVEASGARHPEWTLDAMEAVVLAALLRGLRRAGDEHADSAAPCLLVRGAGAVLPGCRELRLRAGEVCARTGAGARHLVDPGGAVHAWLLESARRRLAPGAYRALTASLGVCAERRVAK